MPTRTELIKQARTWIDVPNHPSGAERVGCNCLGLLIGILREVGGFEEVVKEANNHIGFSKPVTPGDLLRKLSRSKHLQIIRPLTVLPGNLAVFFSGNGLHHIAIITEPGVILHSSERKKKVIEHLIPDNWRVVAEFQLTGLDD